MSTTDPHENDHEIGRPATYASRFAAVMRNLSRMTKAARPSAYSSEVGESFRPIIPAWAVRALYGISWAYVFVDTGVKTWGVREHGMESMAYTACDMFAWHAVASMALPAFTIHSIVKYSGKFLEMNKRIPDSRFKRLGPTIIGLGTIPFIIHPLDHATDWVFDNTLRKLYADKLKKSESHH